MPLWFGNTSTRSVFTSHRRLLTDGRTIAMIAKKQVVYARPGIINTNKYLQHLTLFIGRKLIDLPTMLSYNCSTSKL